MINGYDGDRSVDDFSNVSLVKREQSLFFFCRATIVVNKVECKSTLRLMKLIL